MLAQKGVSEFHKNTQWLMERDGIVQVTKTLDLEQESGEVQERLLKILTNYHEKPILLKRKIFFSRGDEGFPEPIKICCSNITFNFLQ